MVDQSDDSSSSEQVCSCWPVLVVLAVLSVVTGGIILAVCLARDSTQAPTQLSLVSSSCPIIDGVTKAVVYYEAPTPAMLHIMQKRYSDSGDAKAAAEERCTMGPNTSGRDADFLIYAWMDLQPAFLEKSHLEDPECGGKLWAKGVKILNIGGGAYPLVGSKFGGLAREEVSERGRDLCGHRCAGATFAAESFTWDRAYTAPYESVSMAENGQLRPGVIQKMCEDQPWRWFCSQEWVEHYQGLRRVEEPTQGSKDRKPIRAKNQLGILPKRVEVPWLVDGYYRKHGGFSVQLSGYSRLVPITVTDEKFAAKSPESKAETNLQAIYSGGPTWGWSTDTDPAAQVPHGWETIATFQAGDKTMPAAWATNENNSEKYKIVVFSSHPEWRPNVNCPKSTVSSEYLTEKIQLAAWRFKAYNIARVAGVGSVPSEFGAWTEDQKKNGQTALTSIAKTGEFGVGHWSYRGEFPSPSAVRQVRFGSVVDLFFPWNR